MDKYGQILVISGPSGVGKDTVSDIIKKQTSFSSIPSYTTRLPRAGEINGTHYHFVNKSKFFSLLKDNEMIDHAIITGNHYGVRAHDVLNAISGGNNIILNLIPESAYAIKKLFPHAILAFVMPEGRETTRQRLRNRGMTEEMILNRESEWTTPLDVARHYDIISVNRSGQAESTAVEIMRFMAEQSLVISYINTKNIWHDILQSVDKNGKIKYMKPKFFATTNKNKLIEAESILGYKLSQLEIEILEPQEVDVEVVIKAKAKDAYKIAGEPVLVEDTSLELRSWGRLPGALVKWFLKEVGNDGIIRMADASENRNAVAKSSVGYFDGLNTHIFTGEIKGKISKTLRGDNGFGWDSIFIPEGREKTFAEMSPDEKNAVSMRKIAFKKMHETTS